VTTFFLSIGLCKWRPFSLGRKASLEANGELVEDVRPVLRWHGPLARDVARGQEQQLAHRISRRKGALGLDYLAQLPVVATIVNDAGQILCRVGGDNDAANSKVALSTELPLKTKAPAGVKEPDDASVNLTGPRPPRNADQLASQRLLAQVQPRSTMRIWAIVGILGCSACALVVLGVWWVRRRN